MLNTAGKAYLYRMKNKIANETISQKIREEKKCDSNCGILCSRKIQPGPESCSAPA
jgi:hypothetical protein